MLTRQGRYLVYRGDGPVESQRLEQVGYAVLRGVFDTTEIASLCEEMRDVYARIPRDERGKLPAGDHRYEVLNRSAVAQKAIAHERILTVIEPLLGEDCHVIANTCWKNPAGNAAPAGGPWHTDAGPHIPRPPGVPWDERIPYPVFAVAAHLFLSDCPLEGGPTGVLPGSHTSGQAPPAGREHDPTLTWEGRAVVPLVAFAGDVALFVSDLWHRRLPTLPGDPGRLFLQCHYGRRDIAQRLRTTEHVHQLSAEALARIGSERERTLLGLHPALFYDG